MACRGHEAVLRQASQCLRVVDKVSEGGPNQFIKGTSRAVEK